MHLGVRLFVLITTAIGLILISYKPAIANPSFSSPRTDRPKACANPDDCVSREICEQTLVTELALDQVMAGDLCSLKNTLYEWDIIRRKEVLPKAIEYSKWYIERGLFELSAVQLILISIYYLSAKNMAAMFQCTREFHLNLWVRLLRSHDACHAIYRFHPVEKRDELYSCTAKQRQQGVPPEEAFSLCIEYVFYKTGLQLEHIQN